MGIVNSAQQIGGALGLAVLVAVASLEGFQWALVTGTGLSLLAAGFVLVLAQR